jgi:glycosyltransferase involved in cell wall biosynthesis
MKILHVSNMVSHHQLPLGIELQKLVGIENYLFAATERPDLERKNNGWNVEVHDDWILQPALYENDKKMYLEAWKKFDVVLCGERSLDLIEMRLRSNKLTFYMSERWWKPPIGRLRLLSPSFLKMFLRFKRLSNNPNFFYLPTGKFAFEDIGRLMNFNERVFHWGYFTKKSLKKVDFTYSKPIKLLWIGRMLKLKQVDIVLKLCKRLSDSGVDFHLTLVGEGPEKHNLTLLAKEMGLSQQITFQNFVSVELVPNLMSAHEFYIMPSNSYEGWGAVVNEAMSAGMITFASNKIGSATSMINDGSNGFLFDPDRIEELFDKVMFCLNNQNLFRKISNAAILTADDLWSPENVAHRFLSLVAKINANDVKPFKSGPLSRFKEEIF